MTITTVDIVCDVGLPDNTEFPASRIDFQLSGPDYDTVSNDVIPAVTVSAILDGSGTETVGLWPVDRGIRNTFYNVILQASFVINGRTVAETFTLGRIAPPSDEASYGLADLLAQSTGGITVGSKIYATLADAVAAALEAAENAQEWTPDYAQSLLDQLNDQVADAQAAATEAALYDGPKVDEFEELPTVTPEMLPVSAYLRSIKEGVVYQRVASDGDISAPFSGVDLNFVGEVAPVSAFGFKGVGTVDDTARAQAALDWLGRSPRRTLRWDRPTSAINGSLILPDASRWAGQLPTDVQFLQTQDNTPVFLMRPTARRFSFGFYGEMATFVWENDQAGTDTEALGIAIDPQVDIPDGLHHFKFDNLWIENGFSLLVRHPDATDVTCPYWGYDLGNLYYQTRSRGAILNLNSLKIVEEVPQSAGAPASKIKSIYIKPPNAVTDVLVFTANTCVDITSLEVNDAVRRTALITSSNVRISSARYEKCNLLANGSLMDAAGASAVATIGTLELQAVNTAAASDCFGVVAFGGATVNVTGAVIVRDCVASGAGKLQVLRPTEGSGLFGKFVLPPVVKMQTTNNNVALYEKSRGAHVAFASAVSIGPFVLAAVAGVAAGTNMVSAYDGANTYFEIVCPADGYLVGVHIRLSAAITAGTLSFRPYINGSAIGGGAFNAQITSGQDASYYGIHKWEPAVVNQGHKVARGDRLRVQVTPTTVTGGGNATVQLMIAQDAAT